MQIKIFFGVLSKEYELQGVLAPVVVSGEPVLPTCSAQSWEFARTD
jgi:hypothetical protein